MTITNYTLFNIKNECCNISTNHLAVLFGLERKIIFDIVSQLKAKWFLKKLIDAIHFLYLTPYMANSKKRSIKS